jgi:hypothetical protein
MLVLHQGGVQSRQRLSLPVRLVFLFPKTRGIGELNGLAPVVYVYV